MKTMNFPTYTAETPVGTLTYGYVRSYRTWSFLIPASKDGERCRMLVKCCGKDQGHKVASLIVGALKRKGVVDNLCRANIQAFLARNA
jgi:hypothetical protein